MRLTTFPLSSTYTEGKQANLSCPLSIAHMNHPVRRSSVINMEKTLYFLYSLEYNIFSQPIFGCSFTSFTLSPSLLYIYKILECRPRSDTKNTTERSLFCYDYVLNERRQRTLMQIRPILGRLSSINSSAGSIAIVQIAGQGQWTIRPAGVVFTERDLSHVYAFVTMSSWTFCLHVLVYITTLT